MVFTESDAANDGLIKREVGREMAKVAKTQNPQMFQHFERVCEEVGREPDEVFGEMCVRSLNNEQYAQNVLNSEINMGQIKADEIRLEDVKYVKQLSEELGLNESEDGGDPIDNLINQRLETVTQSPLDNLQKNRKNPEGVNGEVLSHMESLQSEISRIEKKIEDQDGRQEAQQQPDQNENKSVDDLFNDSSGNEGDSSPQEPNHGNVVEVSSEEDSTEREEVEEEDEDGPTEEQLDEALEGTGGSVDDVWEDDDTDELDPQMEIPSEEESDNPFVTSEDGEEE